MPKGKHRIDYKQKRAAHWAARFCVYGILLQPYPQQEETSLSFG